MIEQKASLDLLTELGLLQSETSPEIRALYQEALSKLDLQPLDYLSIRDLLAMIPIPTEGMLALLICMFDVMREGSLCLTVEQAALEQRLGKFARARSTALSQELLSFLLSPPPEQALVTSRTDAFAPLIVKRHGSSHRLYWQRYLIQEELLEHHLRRLIHEPPPSLSPAAVRTILDEVLTRRPLRRNGSAMTLNQEQQLALALGLMQNFTIISGGPGTGKTSIIISLLRCLVRTGIAAEDICLAAPTGRAAQRLTDTLVTGLRELDVPQDPLDTALLKLKGQTLHHLLHYSPASHSFTYGPQRPLPARVLIIDEVSMVDVTIMAQFLQAVGPDSRVVLLGDKNQLPSVDAGAILAELIPREAYSAFTEDMVRQLREALPSLRVQPSPITEGALTNRIVILNQTYRSSEAILTIADAINRGDATVAEQLPLIDNQGQLSFALLEGGCRLIHTPQDQPMRWQMLLDGWANLYLTPRTSQTSSYAELIAKIANHDLSLPSIDLTSTTGQVLDQLLKLVEETRVLTAVREGPRGCETINRYISNRLRHRLDPQADSPFFSGLPLMVIRNSYQRELFNGDVGLTLRDQSNRLHVVFRSLGACLSLPLEMLPAHEPAFAITVHKSQGSEYDRILLVLPNKATHSLLSREILYTGLTRARHTAILAAVPDVLTTACRRRIHRESGLDIWPAPTQPVPPPKPARQARKKRTSDNDSQLSLPGFDGL